MSLRVPISYMSLPLPRRIAVTAVVGFVTLAGIVVPAAHARKPVTRPHSKLHAFAHAFLDVALPGVGFLPGDVYTVPDEGQKYELKLIHSHTGDMVDVVYRIGDAYIPEALDQLNQFLRDSHNEQVNPYDPRTFDVLHTMLAKLGRPDAMIDVLSGYRSQETNDELRASGTTNAAEHSQHIVAKAVDLRVDGVPAPLVRDAALSLNAGGVGYYPSSQFVHVDVGPVRKWTYTRSAAHRHSRRSHARSRHTHHG